MKGKAERISRLKEIFTRNGSWIERVDVCRELDISGVTLTRYIKELRKNDADILLTGSRYFLVKNGLKNDRDSYTRSYHVSLKILMYIYNNNPCSRRKLQESFCKRASDDNAAESRMTARNLDMHIRRLADLGLIEKYRSSGYFCFRICGEVIQLHNLSIGHCIAILSYLRLYKPFFPFQNTVHSIMAKLTYSLANHTNKITAFIDDLHTSGRVISVSSPSRNEQGEEKLIYELAGMCKTYSAVQMELNNGEVHDVIAINMLFNWKSENWYFIFRKLISKTGFESVRVDKITTVKETGNTDGRDISELEKCRTDIEQRINRSFGTTLDKAINIKVIFLDHYNVIEKARNELVGKDGICKELPGVGLYYYGDIEGVMDFLSWIRRFGSSVIIISPGWLREKHIYSARKVLEIYGEEFYE